MDPRHIVISDVGKVIELTAKSVKVNGTVPSGKVFVDGYGVGDVGAVVLRDRQHLAQDGMPVVVVSMSGEDGQVISGPDIISRWFVYVKGSEGLMEERRQVAVEALERCATRHTRDWAAIKSEIKGALSNYLYKKTKRNPMILPVIMEELLRLAWDPHSGGVPLGKDISPCGSAGWGPCLLTRPQAGASPLW
mgnify:CR=1 FL=1